MKTLGKRFRCIQDVIFGVDVIYKKGKIYKSEVEGCITNEEGNPCHEWIEGPDDEYWKTSKTAKITVNRIGCQ